MHWVHSFRPAAVAGRPFGPALDAVWRSTGCSCQSAMAGATHTGLWGREGRRPWRRETRVSASRSATTRAREQPWIQPIQLSATRKPSTARSPLEPAVSGGLGLERQGRLQPRGWTAMEGPSRGRTKVVCSCGAENIASKVCQPARTGAARRSIENKKRKA